MDCATKRLSSPPAPQALSQESEYLYFTDNCGLGSLCIRVAVSDGSNFQARHVDLLK